MSWKAEAHKIYEERVVNDSLARLAERLDLKGLPLSDDELKTWPNDLESRSEIGKREESDWRSTKLISRRVMERILLQTSRPLLRRSIMRLVMKKSDARYRNAWTQHA